MAEVIANMNARRKWALENAACVLVVFGSMAVVLLFDSRSVRAESTMGSAAYAGSPPGYYSHQDRTTSNALLAWLQTACTDAVVPGEGSNPAPTDFAGSN